MQLKTGTSVERYTVVQPLAKGGMATVYLVRHRRLGSLYALKVLEVPSPEIRERLIREGQVQGQLRHPNVAAVLDTIDIEGSTCLLMEMVDGPGLHDLIADYPISLAQADDLARGLLSGVGAAHTLGLVHRDLKPANILLSIEPTRLVAKVTDFGLAKVLRGDGGPAATQSGVAMGTPSFMAPEQIRDSSKVDARADVFSLGAVLYELVTGERAFTGGDTFEIFDRIIGGDYIQPHKLRPDLPRRMVQAIAEALANQAVDRPSDANELLAVWTDGEPAPTNPWTVEQIEKLRQRSKLPQLEQISTEDALLHDQSLAVVPSSEATMDFSPDISVGDVDAALESPSTLNLSPPEELEPEKAEPPPVLPSGSAGRKVWIVGGVIAAIALAAGSYWMWDKSRLVIRTYAGIELVGGELVPLGPSADNGGYRVTTKGGLVQRATVIHALDGPGDLAAHMSERPAILEA
ncbi:MAG: serine/threonine protein kinase, partial [Proteobacteria bacterium]|nr:serine/threonine protein kinase [Pseudomonadota bacterium]